MNRSTLHRALSWLAAGLLVIGGPVSAADTAAIESVGGNSLASEHLVLQITESDMQRQNLVLNVANNVLKARGGPDQIDVEVVAFGPGISMLFANNHHAERIQSLADQGVRFSACRNSIAAATRKLGEEPGINPAAEPVEAGIARILDLVDAEYVLVRP